MADPRHDPDQVGEVIAEPQNEPNQVEEVAAEPQNDADKVGEVIAKPQSDPDKVEEVIPEPQNDQEQVKEVTAEPQNDTDQVGEVTAKPQNDTDQVEEVMTEAQNNPDEVGEVTAKPQNDTDQVEEVIAEAQNDPDEVKEVTAEPQNDPDQVREVIAKPENDPDQVGEVIAKSENDPEQVEEVTVELQKDPDQVVEVIAEPQNDPDQVGEIMTEPQIHPDQVEVEPQNGPDQVLEATSLKTCVADGRVQLQITEEGPNADSTFSVYTMLRHKAEVFGKHPALAVKRDGEWKYWTYKDYFEESCTVAKALIKLGLERFHGVCIMGFNSPEWMIANFGCIFAGGMCAGIYTTNSPEACRHIAENCRAQIIFVEDTVCLKKILAVKQFLPEVKAIVQWKGITGAPGVMSWAELLAVGKAEKPQGLEKRLSLAAVNQCCTLIYTSGTTGPPKGVMCSQDFMTWGARQYLHIMEIETAKEVFVSYLPLSHLAAQMLDGYLACTVAATVYFAQPDALKGSLVQTLQEVQPTCFLGVPRVWEKIYEKMQEAGAQVGGFKKKVATWAKHHGLNNYEALREGRHLSLYEGICHSLAKGLILNKVKKVLGFERAYKFVSGAAPISKDVLEYFMSLDLPIMEGYGMSESLGLCSMGQTKAGMFRIGSVGKVVPQTVVRLDESSGSKEGEGEILMKGRNVCMGYLAMPEATDAAIDNEGWLHTGDIGCFDSDGFLYITGRLKELVITAGGENIPPVYIEDNIKKLLPCISNCMLVGDKQKFLSVLLTLKAESDIESGEPLQELTPSCISWMNSFGCPATTIEDVIKDVQDNPNGQVAKAIDEAIKKYNEKLAISNAQKVQRWTILPHDFSLPTGELNSTLKLKRKFVLEKYKEKIETLYTTPDELSKNSKL
ncbi:acyl-CoA synthetase bubblegum family member 1 isoform X3 [Oratosquilla oratoria]|uniref:acyl-CoA synthetase bubblegum family member 1 isoform X3 n=1 Tax=Oratosquilla oratoria TaxID=337810 RepID=UPI003F7585A8